MRTVVAVAVAAAALSFAAPASAAVEISGGVTSINVHGTDPGLVISASSLGSSTFTLANVGDSHVFDVLQIGTSEGSIELDDWVQYGISVAFSFASPAGALGNPVTGSTGGFIHLNPFNSCGVFTGGCGYVDWAAPQLFSFGNGGQFQVELSDAIFGTPGTANVQGRFTLLADSTPAVPEPATWAMLLIGFGAVGASLRKRNSRGQMRLRIA